MIGWTRVVFWWLALLVGVCGAFAQTAPGDSLREPAAPAGSTAVVQDTLAAAMIPEAAPPTPVLPLPTMPRFGSQAVRTSREIRELASFSLGEAFVVSPGVHLLRRGWHGLPQYLGIRGARADDVVYLLDGIPLSDNQIEVLNLNWLPIAGVKEAEVIGGGLSSILGSGALAGVLQITSVTAMPEFPESEVTAWWGSHDDRAVSLRFNRKITNRLGVLATYENLGSGGWTDNSSSEADKLSGNVTALFGDKTRFDLGGFSYRGDFEWPDSCPTFLTTSAADQGNDRDFLKASILSGEDRRFHVHYYRLGASESYSSAETSYVHDAALQGVEMGLSWQAADSAITGLGAGFKGRRIESSSLGNRTSNDLYVYALKERRSGRWRIQGSIRLEKNSDFDTEAGLGLAARFAPRRGVCLFGRLDRSYSFPSFQVLYGRGRDEPADSRIKTETSMGLELGATLAKGPALLSVSALRRDTDGLACLRADDSCGVYLDPAAEVDLTGIEVSLALNLRPWLEAEVSYGFNRCRYRQGDRPAYVPEDVIAAGASLSKTLSEHISVGITLAGRYVSPVEVGARFGPCETYPVCIRSAELPEYISGMIHAHIDLDRAMVFVKVQNVGDSDISTGWGRPRLSSRSYEFGISVLLAD